MDGLTAFGLFAVTAMVVCYALEGRSSWFILGFAGACALGSVYGFLQGAWPFGVCGAMPVSPVRSWCVASAVKPRSDSSMRSTRFALSRNAREMASISPIPDGGGAAALKSPSPTRAALRASRSSGRASWRAWIPASRAAAAMAASWHSLPVLPAPLEDALRRRAGLPEELGGGHAAVRPAVGRQRDEARRPPGRAGAQARGDALEGGGAVLHRRHRVAPVLQRLRRVGHDLALAELGGERVGQQRGLVPPIPAETGAPRSPERRIRFRAWPRLPVQVVVVKIEA